MTGKLSKNFHGVGIGPLSNILAVKSWLKSAREVLLWVKALQIEFWNYSCLNRYLKIAHECQQWYKENIQFSIFCDFNLQSYEDIFVQIELILNWTNKIIKILIWRMKNEWRKSFMALIVKTRMNCLLWLFLGQYSCQATIEHSG